jgi:hypothetical protein
VNLNLRTAILAVMVLTVSTFTVASSAQTVISPKTTTLAGDPDQPLPLPPPPGPNFTVNF